ncbi:MAG: endonuclease/exonuclease/phosphatase family protein [Bacteroidaceae bacterium]|nr:endonuclease/exonuclease/phosphatase family protein [Bacteroidaceae bacterium]
MGKLALYKFAYFISIVLTFILMILTILGAFAGNVNPKYNLFMAGLGLILPILLIINAGVFLYWLCRWKIWVAFPLVALAVNYHYISATIQIKVNDDIAANGGNALKLMTFNVRNFIDDNQDDSADEIKSFLEDENISVVCLQEYKDYVNGRPERICKFLADRFPYQAISGSIATFSKLPIIKKDYITFRESNNCAQWVDIETGHDKTIRIINVHMQTTGINSALRQAAKMENQGIAISEGQRMNMVTGRMEYEYIRRAEQADIISDIVKDTQTPIILCGDFNDTPASYTYKRLKGKLKDGFKSAGSGYMYTYRGAKGLMRIDYIFHSQKLEGMDYYSPSRDWSDHNPVIMELTMPE